ncbi:gamma-butyrobetaine dioxygenase-like [Anneissia japonica]|uniref:gamma-butyrobetaine dioxygenase-like n=1 Tax=Anneissia japonica TaxID=1529436 RepID=UPI001425A83F|nr:gamma-butyrobetaine dioxygenase-like [Anneissia japonica]XP_033106288.1 gamma-butyrobetaine dioxygenase-like [Anneissia japonica]
MMSNLVVHFLTRNANRLHAMRWIRSLHIKMPIIHVPAVFMFGKTSSVRSFSEKVSSTSSKLISKSGSDNGFNKVQAIFASDDGKFVNVSWNDGRVTHYPYIWLRDNCRCKHCYDFNLNERVFSLKDINASATLHFSELAEDSTLKLHDTSGHTTVIHPSWLKDRNVGEIRSDPLIKQIHWGSDVMTYLPRFQYDDVINNSTTLYKWMKCTKEYGLSWIKGAPTQNDELRTLGKRLAHLRETFYGVVSRVESKADPFFLGYTSKELPLHTDYTYGANIPGIVFLHGIKCAPSGGKSWLVDGFKLAKDLKKNDPTAFKLLSTGILNYEMNGFDIGPQFDHRCNTQVIRVNWRGDVDKIAYNDYTRTEYLTNISVDDMPAYYEALTKFISMAYSQEYLLEAMIEEGDIVAIDNLRLLHGRDKFEISDGKGRIVESICIDMDDFNSRLRVLSQSS